MLVAMVMSFDLIGCWHRVAAKGAGRAFPIDSENLAIESFQETNQNLVRPLNSIIQIIFSCLAYLDYSKSQTYTIVFGYRKWRYRV